MHVLDLYQRPISVRREGSVGTIIYFYFQGTSSLFFFSKKKKREEKKCGENDKKILEHQFGRDDGSRSSFWSWY